MFYRNKLGEGTSGSSTALHNVGHFEISECPSGNWALVVLPAGDLQSSKGIALFTSLVSYLSCVSSPGTARMNRTKINHANPQARMEFL